MRLAKISALAGALMMFGSACVDRPPYSKCIDDGECLTLDRRDGRCLNSIYGPFCAFPDKDCSTMWRWYILAPQTLVNQCVDPSVPLDAAVDAPPVDMSSAEGG
jgi:hypothetical protein